MKRAYLTILLISLLVISTLASVTFAAQSGKIVGWGSNVNGTAIPPDGNDFIAIAAGQIHSLALKADGTIIGWGYNTYGQATPPDGNDFIAIAAGSVHSLALKSDGSIVGWGSNYDTFNQYSGQATPPDGNNFKAIAAAAYYSLALKSDGTIVGWGYNSYYGLATPPDGNNFKAIAAGVEHGLALKSDGSIVGWGRNIEGQATPPAGNNFIAIAAGGEHSLGLKSNGNIVGWGMNYYGQATPPDGNNFTAIAAGIFHSLALKSDGTIVGWGYNGSGEATPPDGNDFISIAAGFGYSLAIQREEITDLTPPAVTVAVPYANPAVQDGITLTADANDDVAVDKVYFYVREPNGGNGTPIGKENLAGVLNSVNGKYEFNFDTTQLKDGSYVVLAKAVDISGNIGWSKVVPFSTCNSAVLNLTPATGGKSKAGGSVSVKFSLSVQANKKTKQAAIPFVYNEDLEIRIYQQSGKTNILVQTSRYGTGATDYQIDLAGQLYITSFKTDIKPTNYPVEVWRPAKNLKLGNFSFSTAK